MAKAKKKIGKRVTRVVAAEGHTNPKKNKTDTCFVIMPFGGHFDNYNYYAEIYAPAIEASGLTSERSDNLFRPGSIVEDIWRFTKEAKIILADLSQMNPNVFYELGLAHAITKPVILVVENIEYVPFDLRNLRVHIYDKNESNWGEKLKGKIQNSIAEILENPKRSILTTFMETTDEPSVTATDLEKAFIDLTQDVDRLRHEVKQMSGGLMNLQSGGITNLPSGGLMNLLPTSNLQQFELDVMADYILQKKAADPLINLTEAINAVTGKSDSKKQPDEK